LKIACEKSKRDDGYVTVSSAGSFLKRTKPAYDSRTCGYSRLTDLLTAYPKKYELKTYPGKGNSTVIAYKCRVNSR